MTTPRSLRGTSRTCAPPAEPSAPGAGAGRSADRAAGAPETGTPETGAPETRGPETGGPGPVAVDHRELRACLGSFLTGVTVVTFRRGTRVHGITVNSFTSVSLDPPLVLVGLDRGSRAAALLGSCPYAINVLTEGQCGVALHFAGRPMTEPVRWAAPGPDEVPLLADTVGHLVCRPWRRYDGGDHELLVGSVVGFHVTGGPPLAFFRGGFPRLAADSRTEPWSGSLDDPANAQRHQPAHPMTTEGRT
ncbi:flavin reductase family protein [Streptomyces sp. B15]|uniref:flavin reductase family protein n=1 Tax=Streptomyces sp. B15 TaxID=1537797 RepID=UPI001B36EFB7|nr:flavin reductase family protein [Streptomyces sp. B15]MBQ1125314.1 flavin reductase [Streptomyces sp. B15]